MALTPVSWVVGIILIIEVVILGIAGFGTGALACTTGCTPLVTLQQQGFGPAELSMYVAISNPEQAAVTDAYSSGNSLYSTPVTMNLVVITNGTCSGNGGAGWAIGPGRDAGYWWIWITDQNGSQVPFQMANVTTSGSVGYGGAGPTQSWGSTYYYYSISQNSTSASEYCYPASAGFGYQATAGYPGHGYFTTSFDINGKYDDYDILHASFRTDVRYCNGYLGNGNQATQCQLSPTVNPDSYSASSVTATAGYGGGAQGQAYLRSGYAQLFAQQGVAYNGGQLLVPYVTGYAGPNAYTAEFLEGPCMPNPGSVIQSVSVPSSTAGVLTFNVPANLSRFVSPGSCPPPYTANTAQVWLFSPWQAAAVIWKQIVDISPNSAPGIPTLTGSDLSGHNPAQINDQYEVSITANYTNSSGKIAFFSVSGYYMAGESTPPVSSLYWIGGNPQGSQITGTCTGSVCSAVWSFQITQSAPITAIVSDVTNGSQQNQAVITIQVSAPTCQTCGTPSSHTNLQLWDEIAPWLLSAIFVTLGVFVATIPQVPPAVKGLAVLLGFVVPAALFAFGAYGVWFGTAPLSLLQPGATMWPGWLTLGATAG